MGQALRRQRQIIDISLTTISDHLDLNGVSPDEVVRLVKACVPKVAIRVHRRGGRHLYNLRKKVRVRIGEEQTKFSVINFRTSSVS